MYGLVRFSLLFENYILHLFDVSQLMVISEICLKNEEYTNQCVPPLDRYPTSHGVRFFVKFSFTFHMICPSTFHSQSFGQIESV